MERSSRCAGVRTVRNMQYHGTRSLAISLAIVLVITKSPANGFIIRDIGTLDATTDMDTEGSALLEVWSNVENQKNAKTLNNNDTKAELSDAVIALTQVNNATTKTGLDNNITTEKLTTMNSNGKKERTNIKAETSTVFSQIMSNIKFTTTNKSHDVISDDLTIQTTTKNPNVNIDHNESTKIGIITSLQNSITSKSDNINRELENTKAVQSFKNNDSVPTAVKTVDNNTSDIENRLSLIPESKAYSESMTDNTFSTDSTIMTTEITTNLIDAESSAINLDNETGLNVESSSIVITEDFGDNTKIDEKTENYFENSETTTGFPNDEAITTEISTDETVSTTLPPWKHYKTIHRKRITTTSTEETTISSSTITTTESFRSVLENLLNNTPIPSLVELKNELLNTQEYANGVYNTVNENVTNVNRTLEPETNTPTAYEVGTQTSKLDTQPTNLYTEPLELDAPPGQLQTTLNFILTTQATKLNEDTLETKTAKETDVKLDIVSSKRAGYLDNTETTSLKPERGTLTTVNENSNSTDSYGTTYEPETAIVEVSQLYNKKNLTELESQSQLVEDAIKEELLMEKTLNNNELLKTNQRSPALLDYTSQDKDESSSPQNEESLGVKPIKTEKNKVSTLYTVSPNYKPLKKLDVQHSKQFVRDPDDNSWRNESISSLGIVFKPKNASKSFTEVLKNKTTELSIMAKQGNKSDVPDLRVRLEKIAEVRKSKKKRINKFRDLYSDYEENSEEATGSTTKEVSSSTTPMTPPSSTTKYDLSANDIWKNKLDIFSTGKEDMTTTEKLKKYHHVSDYYDSTDDYDADYATLAKLDLMKFTLPKQHKDTATVHPSGSYSIYPKEPMSTTPMSTFAPDRQATIQYFPPTKKVIQKAYASDYDDDFKKRLNEYTYNESTKPTEPTKQGIKHDKSQSYPQKFSPVDLEKSLYLRSQLSATDPQYEENGGHFNRASYVIRHYKDFINNAAKDTDYDTSSAYSPFTKSPMTMSDVSKLLIPKEKPTDIYEYDTHFSKDIVNRFVDNFNQNSERFKVDFPIIFNNSVVHRHQDDSGKVTASSSAIMKRLYETPDSRSSFLTSTKPCNGNCDSINVDLSPAYELHYYVPDQEEKEQIHPLPTNYKL